MSFAVNWYRHFTSNFLVRLLRAIITTTFSAIVSTTNLMTTLTIGSSLLVIATVSTIPWLIIVRCFASFLWFLRWLRLLYFTFFRIWLLLFFYLLRCLLIFHYHFLLVFSVFTILTILWSRPIVIGSRTRTILWVIWICRISLGGWRLNQIFWWHMIIFMLCRYLLFWGIDLLGTRRWWTPTFWPILTTVIARATSSSSAATWATLIAVSSYIFISIRLICLILSTSNSGIITAISAVIPTISTIIWTSFFWVVRVIRATISWFLSFDNRR